MGSPAYESRITEAKATKKVDHNFPKIPEKKKLLSKNLAAKLFPGENLFKKKVRKNPSVLTDPVKATIVDLLIEKQQKK